MIHIYYNSGCSKCNSAVCILEESGKDFETIEYLKTPPSKQELENLIKMLGIEPFELLRKSEPIFVEKFENKSLTGEECIQAMLDYPILIERPIVIIGEKAVICRPPEKLLEFLKK